MLKSKQLQNRYDGDYQECERMPTLLTDWDFAFLNLKIKGSSVSGESKMAKKVVRYYGIFQEGATDHKIPANTSTDIRIFQRGKYMTLSL